MVELGNDAWARLYSEVLLVALRMTRTRDGAQQATHVDRAREATQQAFDRYLRVRPADLDTIDAVRKYLVGSVRSALGNAKDEEARRRQREQAASTEQATVQGAAVASAEVVYLEDFEARRRRERAVRALARLRDDLTGDEVALGTIDCIERGQIQPVEQARVLGTRVEEIYAARKRRKRALATILGEPEPEDGEEKT